MSVITLGRQTRRTVPWRTLGVLVALLLLLATALLLYAGGQRRVPAPFGPAANGSIAYVKTEVSYENLTGYREPFGDIVAVNPATGKETVLVGRVLSGGSPVGGAFVRLLDGTGEFTAEVVASASGDFRFFAAPGTWTLRALSRSGNGERTVTAEGPGLHSAELAVV